MVLSPLKRKILSLKILKIIMGYKLKTHSGAAKGLKKLVHLLKAESANRNHILNKAINKKEKT